MVPQKQPNPVGLSPTATIPELQQSGSFVDRRKWHFQESGFQITSLLLVFAKCQLCSVSEIDSVSRRKMPRRAAIFVGLVCEQTLSRLQS
jgi:hypothetical protein